MKPKNDMRGKWRAMAYLDNLRTFLRVYELGSMSAAARDQRISAAVASARIAALEDHLGVRLFQRTTRKLHPTEQGRRFYRGASGVMEAVAQAEAEVTSAAQSPRGTLYVAAPLGLGRRILAPLLPQFRAQYPLVTLRLRLSDRHPDLAAEGLDAVFFLGLPADSALRIRKIADCPRLLCAAPDYLARRGLPVDGEDLKRNHDCLNLRYPGASEFQWPLEGPEGVSRVAVSGPLESDDGDVLTDWARAGQGVVLKPRFEVAGDLAAGRLVPVLEATPPVPVQLGCLYSPLRRQDPLLRLFLDFMTREIRAALAAPG